MNKTIFITGGASGIGLGVAQHLGQQGHHIIIADLNLTAAQDACNALSENGVSTQAVQLDVGNIEQIGQINSVLNGQKVDVLINNAGIQHVSKLEEFPPEKWQLLINIMLVGPALLTQQFLPS